MIEYGYVEWNDGNTVSGPMQLSDAIDFAELSHGKFIKTDEPALPRRFDGASWLIGVVSGFAAHILFYHFFYT